MVFHTFCRDELMILESIQGDSDDVTVPPEIRLNINVQFQINRTCYLQDHIFRKTKRLISTIKTDKLHRLVFTFKLFLYNDKKIFHFNINNGYKTREGKKETNNE